MNYKEIESEIELVELLKTSECFSKIAFQSINFIEHENLLHDKHFDDCIFLGCQLSEVFCKSLKKSNLIFPIIDIPFNPYVNSLYNKDTLFGGYEEGKPESYEKTLDKKVYNHYMKEGKVAGNIKETLSRRLHDHAITDALYDFIANYEEKRIVAIMGGHSLSRADKNYLAVAKISKKLTELKYLMVSGGGPGAMEATHLGAWFAGRDDNSLVRAIKTLSEAPTYKDEFWLDKAFKVIRENPNPNYESVGIPTWLYGHEPPTPFATRIAKYFANSVREDGLLTIAKGGVIFAPGSAGTIQEIFQEATQNHYLSFGYASPMVFFDSKYWIKHYPIYPLLVKMTKQGKYKNLILSNHDEEEDVVSEILNFSANI